MQSIKWTLSPINSCVWYLKDTSSTSSCFEVLLNKKQMKSHSELVLNISDSSIRVTDGWD